LTDLNLFLKFFYLLKKLLIYLMLDLATKHCYPTNLVTYIRSKLTTSQIPRHIQPAHH